MGLLSLKAIKNYITKNILELDSTNTTTSEKKANKEALIKVETEAPVDKYINSKDNQNNNLSKAYSNRNATEDTIANLPSASFNIRKLIKDGLIEKITGKTKEDFEKLNRQQQNLVINAVKATISKLEDYQKKGLINPNTNKDGLLVELAHLLYEAISDGSFRDIEDYENSIGNINANLGEDFDNLSPEEQKNIIKRERIKYKNKLDKELATISNLPEEERRKAENRIRNKYRHAAKGRFFAISTQNGTKAALNSLVILDSRDLSMGFKLVMKTRRNSEEASSGADYADFDFSKQLVKDFKEIGDEISTDSFKDYNSCLVSYKTESGAYSYEKEYLDNRKMYEVALKKQQAGENLSSEEIELLNTMNSSYYTATAQGIGNGILDNKNMTVEQKAKLIAEWETDAKNFGDYDVVTKEIQTQLDKNPQYKELADLVKKHIQERNIDKAKPKDTSYKENTAKTTTSQKQNQTFVHINTPATTVNKNRSYNYQILNASDKGNSDQHTTQTSKKLHKIANSPTELTKAVKEQGIINAIEQYGAVNIISITLNNPNLKYKRPELATKIKSYDLNTLKEIALVCSGNSFVWLCKTVNSEFAAELKNIRNNLSYCINKQLENVV